MRQAPLPLRITGLASDMCFERADSSKRVASKIKAPMMMQADTIPELYPCSRLSFERSSCMKTRTPARCIQRIKIEWCQLALYIVKGQEQCLELESGQFVSSLLTIKRHGSVDQIQSFSDVAEDVLVGRFIVTIVLLLAEIRAKIMPLRVPS